MSLSLLADDALYEGKVFTLQGDTLEGQIKYQADNQLSYQCHFCQSGSDSFKSFLPDQILGFSFDSNGRHFVSMDMPYEVSEKEEKRFVEALVVGELSLYVVYNLSQDNLYLFHDNNGKSALYKFENMLQTS